MISNIKILIFALLLFSAAFAYAAPQGGVVVGGDAGISQGGGNTSINQGSDKAIINWDSFNVGAGESVNFNQPGSSSVILNRVTGGDMSQIFGNISANGKVFIVNKSGVVVGRDAVIDTGSFLASSADIANNDFMNGNYLFEGSSGDIINMGTIRANSGSVSLLGKKIINNGSITAPAGVFVAAGGSFRLIMQDNNLVDIIIEQAIADAYISNSVTGLIDGGAVVMLSAKSTSDMLASAVNNAGVIRASSIATVNGQIKLVSSGGSVENSGVLEAVAVEMSGERVGQSGDIVAGKIDITSQKELVITKDTPPSLSANGGLSYINMDKLSAQLASSAVSVTTGQGDITITGGAGSVITGINLKLTSAKDILISNSGISVTGDIYMDAARSIISKAVINAANLNIKSAGGLVSFSNIASVAAINAESKNGTIALSGLGDLNISKAESESLSIEAAGGITVTGAVSKSLYASAGADINISTVSGDISAQSGQGSISIENNNIGDVVINRLISNNGAITYTQNNGGLLTLNDTISSNGALLGIANRNGRIQGGFDFVKNSNNISLDALSILLRKNNAGNADIDQQLLSKLITKNLGISANGDITILSNINSSDLTLQLTSDTGRISTGTNILTVLKVTASAYGDIDLLTDVTEASLTSTAGNISITENNDISISTLRADNGKVTVGVNNAGVLKISNLSAKDGVDITTADNVEMVIKTLGSDLKFDIHNGLSNKLSIINDKNIELISLMNGLTELALISSNDINIYTNDISSIDKLTLKGATINGGSDLNLKSKEVIFSVQGDKNLTIDSESLDITGGSYNITLLRATGTEFKDLDDDKYSISAANINIISDFDVSVANYAGSSSFNVKSANFILSDYSSSILARDISITASGNISGTGRITAANAYLSAEKIGVGSAILLSADNAKLEARSVASDEEGINISAPSWFHGVKDYEFITPGLVYLNGRLTNITLYSLIKESSEKDLFPMESKMRMADINTPVNYDSELITVELDKKKSATSILNINRKIELK